MKQKIYISGVVSALIVYTGIIFKVNHWAGANILLTVGMATFVLLFLPLALINSFKADDNNQSYTLYIVTWITCLVIFTSMLFKIMDWPHAGIMLAIALPFPFVVFLPVFLFVTARIRNFNIYNTVFILMFLGIHSVVSALLALNVTRQRVTESLNISLNYNRMEIALNKMPVSSHQSAVIIKIDKVLDIINEYQNIVLKHEGTTRGKWDIDPGASRIPDSVRPASVSLLEAGDSPAGTELVKELNSLISEMQNTPGYKEIAKVAPDIFDLGLPDGTEPPAAIRIFTDSNISWALIYLDGLENNLKLIRTAGIIDLK